MTDSKSADAGGDFNKSFENSQIESISNPEIDIDNFDVAPDGKYEWAIHALDVLASMRTFQDIVNKENVKEELYTAARILISQLVPMNCIAFMEVSEDDMSFVLADCSPRDKSDFIQSVVDKQIEKGTFSWAIQQNKIVTIPCEETKKTLLLHVLVTPLGVKGMFVGILDYDVKNIHGIGLDTISVVLQNLSSSLDTYFSKKLVTNYNQQLETQIKFRTRELEKAKQLAEVANVAKSEFLASMSHELNTPFNIIFGYIDLMLEDLEGVEKNDVRYSLVEDIKKIGLASRSLNKMVRNIIYLAKLEAEKIVVENSFFLLKEMLLRINQKYSADIEKNNNVLSLNINIDDLALNSDLNLLETAIDHLLDNACKFTENGNVSVDVSSKSLFSQEVVVISVSDTGIGIAEDDLKLLFSSFTQLDGGVQKRFEGLGLGLAITKRLCQLIGASLDVESKPGVGSVFSIVLPV